MKQYIFMTSNIYLVGGIQNYVASKIKYLKKNDWQVYVFFCSGDNGDCPYNILNEYRDMEIKELVLYPGAWTRNIVNETLNKMVSFLFSTDGDIIVESHNSILALWGELLAERLNAKHMCFICNETFDSKYDCFRENIPFFEFKYKRKELYGIQKNSLLNLFGEPKYLTYNEDFVFIAAIDGSVQDVFNKQVSCMKMQDINICFVGREKKLFHEILCGVKEFAIKHSSNTIQFVIVGKVSEKRIEITNIFDGVKNICVNYLGDLVPIPRELFEKVDVVIATSGCACVAATENVPVIVADAIHHKAIGVLGYTTEERIFSKEKFEYVEVLEDVLFNDLCNNKEFHLPEIIMDDSSNHYRNHFLYVEKSNTEKEYYQDVMNANRNYYKCLGYYLRRDFPCVIKLYRFLRGFLHTD